MEFIRVHQLNIMLFMSGICGILAILSCISKVLSPKRRRILTFLEIAAMLLLIADCFAYRYRGNPGGMGFAAVRVSNFLTFLMPLFMVHEITIYLDDLLNSDQAQKTRLRRLLACEALFAAGVILLIISQFTGLYYYFDETNTYIRGPGNMISFAIPGLIAVIQLSAVIQYSRRFSRLMVVTLIIYTVLPLIATVIPIFAYGISLVNISIVGVAILLYIFVAVDMNQTVKRSREKELEYYKKEKEQRRTLFEQTAEALASAIDAKDKYTHGHSSRVAAYSRQIARECGKSEEECEQILFAALLHDVGKIGIADSISVALLGNSAPIGSIFAALVVSIFQQGANYMSSSIGVTKEIASLITGILLLFAACGNYMKYRAERKMQQAMDSVPGSGIPAAAGDMEEKEAEKP